VGGKGSEIFDGEGEDLILLGNALGRAGLEAKAHYNGVFWVKEGGVGGAYAPGGESVHDVGAHCGVGGGDDGETSEGLAKGSKAGGYGLEDRFDGVGVGSSREAVIGEREGLGGAGGERGGWNVPTSDYQTGGGGFIALQDADAGGGYEGGGADDDGAVGVGNADRVGEDGGTCCAQSGVGLLVIDGVKGVADI
jgi:hypothetical protein